MLSPLKVSGKIYWLGANDRKKHLFENIWPLPNGVAYNCYLINDEKTALVDTIESGVAGDFVEKVESLLAGRSLDYLIINHMELDHSGEVREIIKRYPDVQIIGNSKTFKVVEAYWGNVAAFKQVEDGEELSLGHHNLRFVMTPWVHWPETMMTYDITEQVLFSGDAFGSFGTLDGAVFDDEIDFTYYEEDMRRYFSNIVGKYANMVQKAFKKLEGVSIKSVCPVHGPVWRSNPEVVLGLYDKWSKMEAEDGVVILYASMYGTTERIADYIARKIAEQGVKKIRIHDVSKTHISNLINEIWRYKGVILGSCAYNSQMFPLMEQLTRELEHMGVKNRVLGLFGSYSWNGGGVKSLMKFQESIGWDLVSEPVDIYGIPDAEKFSKCDALAEAMAAKIK